MAKPPEPIDEVLPDATAAVIADVGRIVAQDPQKPAPKAPPGTTDLPHDAARQVVELKVKESLFGPHRPGEVLEAEKPAGAYTLRSGVTGPFILASQKGKAAVILGRYGPDTYPVDLIKAAAKKHAKK